MNTREITIAFELAIAIFAIYLLIRRLVRLSAPRPEAPPYFIQEPREDADLTSDEPLTIAWFELAEDAEKWAQALQQQGLEAKVTGGWPRRIEGTGPPQLQVPAKDATRGIEILKTSQAGDMSPDSEEI